MSIEEITKKYELMTQEDCVSMEDIDNLVSAIIAERDSQWKAVFEEVIKHLDDDSITEIEALYLQP